MLKKIKLLVFKQKTPEVKLNLRPNNKRETKYADI